WSRGRQLVEYGDVSYRYDANRIRVAKETDSYRYEYITNGEHNVTAEYHYDKARQEYVRMINYVYNGGIAESMVISTLTDNGYDTSRYYLVHDVHGNVSRLLKPDGTLCATYHYDSWGNCSVFDGEGKPLNYSTDSDNIAFVNPFRYRGYYYDDETGLYYLQTRYYDPETRRFISPDTYDYLNPTSTHGLNLYLYCNNDPVNYYDPSGHSWDSFWNSVGEWFAEHWKEIVIGTAFIVAGALVTALTAGTGVGFMAAFGSALLSSTIQVGISVGTSILVGGLASIANGGGFFDNIGDTIANAYMWGGIFSGGAQILGGGFRLAANKGVKTGRAGGIKLGKKGVKVLSPDKNNWPKAGGTLIKFGNAVRFDVGAMWGLHMHIMSPRHLPIGAVIAGLIRKEY
ncbi:MAG: RHS repeat-associated core domain-containing protein, partial [Clostridia bacterium]|nr:RHS repeat-associated core domain-containing protein [Clostridia bacterium]